MQEEMLAQTKTETGPAATPFALAGLENVPGVNTAAMDEMLQASQACWTAFAELNAEMVRFASARTQANLEACRDLAQCETIAEVPTLQQTWLQSAAEAYTQEMGRLAEIATAAQKARPVRKK